MKHLRQYIRRIIKERVEIPSTLYHATYLPLLDSIMQDGLGGDRDTVWEDSVRGIVYLTPDPYIAESYAETSDDAYDRFGEDVDIVILEIDTSSLDPELLHIDRNVQDNEGDTLEYHGIIPPSALREIE